MNSIFKYLTWCTIFVCFLLTILNINSVYIYYIYIAMLTNSILGTYLINKNLDKVCEISKVKKHYVIMSDIFTHWICGSFALYKLLNTKPNKNESAISLIIFLSFILYYIIFNNPEDVYNFTNLSNKKLIKRYIIIYFSIVVLMIIFNNNHRVSI